MVVGTTLLKQAGNPYYSPTFGRGGLSAVFACQVLQLSSGAGFEVGIEHKNVEDTSWTSLVSFVAFDAADVKTVNPSGIKEQLRFVYTVTGSTASHAVHFNMLAPAWKPY